jgi:hypothetical protein
MVHVAQHADNLCGQGLIQDRNGLVDIALVALGYGAIFHFAYGSLPDFFNVANKVWHRLLIGRLDCV